MLPYEERLMAYLDGEMPAAERTRIDQMLEANPAARQLVDELRVLSGALKGMPKYQLEAGVTIAAAPARSFPSSTSRSAVRSTFL